MESRRGAAARTQGAVGARKPCCVTTTLLDGHCIPAGEARQKKLRAEVPYALRLIPLSHLATGKSWIWPFYALTLCAARFRLRKKRGALSTHPSPVHVEKSRPVIPRKVFRTAQVCTGNSKRCCYLPQLTHRIHWRTEIIQVLYLKCSCDISPTLLMSDK